MIHLSSNQIDLWCCQYSKIDDLALLDQYFELMNTEERQRYQRFHFKKHQHQYVVTRALVRSVLSLYSMNTTPEFWQFKKNPFGKPTVSNGPLLNQLFFNLAHTEGWIVMAVAQQPNIGVDVENLHKFESATSVAHRFFSTQETKDLFNQPLARQLDYFYALWTLKESYIKARGLGLSIPLNQFQFSFINHTGISIRFLSSIQDDPKLWQFWQFCPEKNYKIALGIKHTGSPINHHIKTYEIVPLSNYAMLQMTPTRQSISIC